MPADVEYKATLDDSEVLAALNNIDRNMVILARSADKHFKRTEQVMEKAFKTAGKESKRASDQMQKGAKLSAVKLGAVSGVVQELTRRFINLAEQSARAFLEIARGGIELNKSLELLEIRITSILDGNQVAARAFLETARETARELKLDYIELSELAAIILPDAKDLEVSAKLAGQALLLARAIGADAKRAQISITEALAGQFVSIRRVLNLSSQQIEKIKELEPAIGRAAAISQVLGDRLEAIGFDAEKIGESFTGVFAVIQSEAKRIQQIFAKPIFEELKEQAQSFLEVFEEHQGDIENMAVAFGDLAASVVQLIGTNLVEFLNSIDYQALERTADALNDMAAAFELLGNILGQLPDDTKLGPLATIIEHITERLVTAAQAAALLKAALDSIAFTPSQAIPFVGPLIAVKEFQKAAEEGLTAQERFERSLRESAEAFHLFDEQIKENEENTRARTEATEEDTQTQLDATQADLDRAQALEELEAAAEGAADATEKISDRFEKLATESGRRLTEIMLDQERERIDDAIDAAQKREDLARENAEKIADIFRKHEQDIADAARDLSRDEEDIARRAARDRAEVERDSANERVDIEREYRRELQRIRTRFEESAAEAERRNDAQAFLEAVRQKDREIVEAKRGRQERLEDASRRAAEQRENLKQQLEYEIEDAKIANARKLEDLRIRLERELEAQRLNYERDLEEQALTEERKEAERARAFARELEDHARKESQRVADLRKSLDTEFETVKKHEDLKREYRVESVKRTVAEVNAQIKRLLPFGSGSQLTPLQQIQGVQEGGPVEVGKPYIVGERGPELFIPGMSGMVLPNQVINLPASPGAATVSNVSTTVSPTFNVAESLFNDPIAVRKLQNLMLGVLTEAL